MERDPRPAQEADPRPAPRAGEAAGRFADVHGVARDAHAEERLEFLSCDPFERSEGERPASEDGARAR